MGIWAQLASLLPIMKYQGISSLLPWMTSYKVVQDSINSEKLPFLLKTRSTTGPMLLLPFPFGQSSHRQPRPTWRENTSHLLMVGVPKTLWPYTTVHPLTINYLCSSHVENKHHSSLDFISLYIAQAQTAQTGDPGSHFLNHVQVQIRLNRCDSLNMKTCQLRVQLSSPYTQYIITTLR